MHRTRIKICGFTRIADVENAVQLGVDALGFVFVDRSPRCVKIQQAKQLLYQLPPFIQTVGLFMNQSAQKIREVLQEIPLNLLQFHGDESPVFCEQFKMPYIKAIPMGSINNTQQGRTNIDSVNGVDSLAYAARHVESVGFLLDSHALGEVGGSGEIFDWHSIPEGFNRPLILAGGLSVSNVREAVQQVRPYAIDVSSGVESAKGIKDKEKMAAFISEMRAGDIEPGLLGN